MEKLAKVIKKELFMMGVPVRCNINGKSTIIRKTKEGKARFKFNRVVFELDSKLTFSLF